MGQLFQCHAATESVATVGKPATSDRAPSMTLLMAAICADLAAGIPYPYALSHPLQHPKTARIKQETRERLVSEAEARLGFARDHPEDEEVVNTTASEIVANLKARKDGWTCERVMAVFTRAACAAHRKTNCLTEIVFAEAMADAKAKDAAYAAGGAAEGLFWGLPGSFKDMFNIVGVDSSIGCSPHCFKPCEKPENEAAIVKVYREAGGIPFCKTAIPQTLLAFECANPIFGVSTNPYASTRTCGGSSGGEGALIALQGSPLGWGTDIGGSLRIPAGYSGICSLKPALGRWPRGGMRGGVPGFEGINAVTGPMAPSVDALTYASRAVLDATLRALEAKRFADQNIVPIPWREPKLPTKLRIGYWTFDGLVKASPACVRAVEQTVDALRKEGHELVPWSPPNPDQALKIFVALSSAEGYKSLLSNIGKDPMEPSMRLVVSGTSVPKFVLKLAQYFVHYVLGDTKFADILSASSYKTAGEYWKWTAERNDYISAFRRQAWEEQGFDFLVCPVQAVPALEHGRTETLSPLSIGTSLFNVIDSTVGVLPVTRVDAGRDIASANYAAGSEGSWILEKRVYGGSDPAYSSEKMAGLPVGIQLVGRQYDEEKVLAFMKLVEGAVGFDYAYHRA
ncbi:uncharacterized protein EHS24_000033 [Apiotrichum porosum]|uniref:amidase n=1 Tax=Apiotrichum porosum TaxID=105984 RepID=A0A427Y907_9TREE|nr:uncharacterized protein EHS24_000033 [Apiotrichum porosum]RSH87525.1 hypothetical protein EHS24_000033 [Apiotrichum porosum]